MKAYSILDLSDFKGEYFYSLTSLCMEYNLNEGSVRNKMLKSTKNFIIFKDYKIERINIKK